MNFMVRTSYPLNKFNDVSELFNKSEARPHSIRTQGMFLRPDLKNGWESYTIYEVDEGKETEFSQWINRVLLPFTGIEGFNAQIDTVMKTARPTRSG
jgi:hypothetical protein